MRRLGLILFLAIFSVALIGCASEKNGGTENKGDSTEKVTLDVALNAQPPAMDPIVTTSTVTRDVSRHVFETLLTVDENYEVAPMLAENYEVSEDGKTITLKLREGLTFHDGSDLTIEDVIASLERWRDISTLGKSFFSQAEFKAEDEHTLIIELEERMYTALQILAEPGRSAIIVPKRTIDEAEEDGLKEFIGTGPFKFDEWKQDQYIAMSKFEDYQAIDGEPSGLAGRKEAKVDEIKFHFVTDSSTRVAGITSGEYDISVAVPFDNVAQLEADDNIENRIDHNGFNAVVFNKKAGLFSDQKARQAALAALNMDEISQAAFSSEAFYDLEPSLMITDMKQWYTDAGKENYNQDDPEKAKQLFDEIGYNGEEVKIISSRDYQDHYDNAVVVQRQLEAAGLNVTLELSDWATVLQKRDDESAYDIFITGFPTEPVPTNYVFLSSLTQWAGWTDSPELDQLINEINAATSDEEAKASYEKLQEAYYDYVPIIKFGNKTTVTSSRANIENIGFLHGVFFWNVEKK
ncbi:ABC transporter substrate-binding protein [Ornithinibacillus sp. 4-3]|uniref:ABC transporter substrate-binding protein n=1 Tax=Ornithinibacillus sp. 4-3 TaxID=3231488 RepID=A0AB39HTS4_9BACI